MNRESLSDGSIEKVAAAIRETADAEIVPRFRRLAERDVEEKTPGEIVTAADRACETALMRRLASIADLPVIGEEAVAADPAQLALLGPETSCWLVDPLDGTANFAAGSPDHAVMVAYLHRGVTTASWIWQPVSGQMYVAERGAGATVNDRPVAHRPATDDSRPLIGVIKDRFLPDDTRHHVHRQAGVLGPVHAGVNCAGIEYPDLATGSTDYILYWRTLPWDHAPGVLLATETGCAAIRPDGSPYRPHSRESGLLVTPRHRAAELRHRLLDPEHRTAEG